MVKMKKYLSNKKAQEYLLFLAKHGNHYIKDSFNTIEDVKKYYRKHGIDAREEIGKAREYGYNPLNFTNLLSGDFQINSSGSSVKTSLIDFSTGKIIDELEGDGVIIPTNHWNTIISSRNSFDKSINTSDLYSLNEAISLAVFGIEAYINQKIYEHNELHDEKLVDNKQNKVNIEEKLVNWLPIITGKEIIDKSNAMWGFYKEAIKIRDNDLVHQKRTTMVFSQNDFIRRINIYRKGPLIILRVLIDAFKEKEVPFKVIETLFYPELECS